MRHEYYTLIKAFQCSSYNNQELTKVSQLEITEIHQNLPLVRRSIKGQNPGNGGGASSVKCPNSGPSTHSKAVKWDFDENLVPSEVPQLEEEVSLSDY